MSFYELVDYVQNVETYLAKSLISNSDKKISDIFSNKSFLFELYFHLHNNIYAQFQQYCSIPYATPFCCQGLNSARTWRMRINKQ